MQTALKSRRVLAFSGDHMGASLHEISKKAATYNIGMRSRVYQTRVSNEEITLVVEYGVEDIMNPSYEDFFRTGLSEIEGAAERDRLWYLFTNAVMNLEARFGDRQGFYRTGIGTFIIGDVRFEVTVA